MPVDFPAELFVSTDSVRPNLNIAFAQTEGGLVVTSRKGEVFWSGRITTPALSTFADSNARERLIAWLYWAVDLNMRVDFVHPKHQFPSEYTEANWPMVADASLVATPNQRTLRIAGATVGLKLKRGDRVAAYQNDLVVHRWVASDLVVGSSLNQDIPVTPRLPVGVLAPGAVVALKNPKMRFVIVPGSIAGDDSIEAVPVSFDVVESLR